MQNRKSSVINTLLICVTIAAVLVGMFLLAKPNDAAQVTETINGTIQEIHGDSEALISYTDAAGKEKTLLVALDDPAEYELGAEYVLEIRNSVQSANFRPVITVGVLVIAIVALLTALIRMNRQTEQE